ncbi:hypothetical protein, partial [Rubrivivax gelatinosus]|uniref:hypothetical protein n=1 Tax=Rubrivivax gelatinosus TaxID=28068 RepID=UPI001A925BEA
GIGGGLWRSAVGITQAMAACLESSGAVAFGECAAVGFSAPQSKEELPWPARRLMKLIKLRL